MDESSDNEDEFVSIDEMLPYVGELKRFQWILGAVSCIMIMPTVYQVLIMSFAGANPTWRCVKNSTYCLNNTTFQPNDDKRCSLPRSEWEFTESKDYSIVTYFDIYCENYWLIECATSIMFLGWGIGGIFLGWAADNYGRKIIIFLSNSVILVSGFVAFVSNIHVFICFRFITGFFISGVLIEVEILLSELVGSAYRPLAADLVWLFYPVAMCVLCLKAYFIRKWKLLFIVCTGPYIFVLLFYPFIPESPRWLRLHGKIDELMIMLKKIARINKKVIPSHIKISPVAKELRKNKVNPLALFRTRKITMISLITSYSALVHGMIYYAFIFAAGNLGDSLYLTFFLLMVTEIPSHILVIVFSMKFGRKNPTLVIVVMAGISCIVLAFLPANMIYGRVIMGMVGKFFITISLGTSNVWSIELFPTTIRAQGIALINVTFTIGSSVAPWIIFRSSTSTAYILYTCMGVATFVCFALLLFLRDTKQLPTLETEEDLCLNSEESEVHPLLKSNLH